MDRFKNLGIIKSDLVHDLTLLNNFQETIEKLKLSNWNKKSIVDEFFKLIPEFKYHDNKKYLDGKM